MNNEVNVAIFDNGVSINIVLIADVGYLDRYNLNNREVFKSKLETVAKQFADEIQTALENRERNDNQPNKAHNSSTNEET